MERKKIIGVLSLQGCVEEHRPHIEALGGIFKEIKYKEDCEGVDSYILPGGESSVMLKIMDNFNLFDFFQNEFSKKPVWGICAGSILMANKILGIEQKSFGLLDMEISRNAYGSQKASFEDEVEGYPCSFIRAPRIEKVGDGFEVLACDKKGFPTWSYRGNKMVTTFHPELSRNFPSPMHKFFFHL